MNRENILKFFCLFGLAVIFILLMRPSDAMTQDLGRHLKLGEIIFKTGSVPNTNLFSYTYPNFPFLNHHWLSEVVFYLLVTYFGLQAVFGLKIVLFLTAIFLIFRLAWKKTDFLTAGVSTLSFLPLFTYRTSERPELFGYIFFAFLVLLYFGDVTKDRFKIFGISFLVLGLWVNFHISFVYGVFLFGFYIIASFFRERDGLIFLKAVPVFAALFLNPDGWKQVIYPFKIFGNYGYRIVENQTVFFLLSRLNDYIYFYFLIVAGLGTALILFCVFKKKFSPEFFVFLIFVGLAVFAVRNFTFLGLAGAPAVAIGLKNIGASDRIKKLLKSDVNALRFFLILILIFLNLTIVFRGSYVWGIRDYYNEGISRFLEKSPEGNIFNNFDIGGYLDYRLYPKYRVFVDNRPEAFPKEFFGEYIKIQTDPIFRKEKFEGYGIKNIIFSHGDLTPWAQEFLAQISGDKNWEVFYLDDRLVIYRR